MAPHLTLAEQDAIVKWAAKHKNAPFIHAKITAARERRDIEPLDITVIGRFMRGQTHRRRAVETRGRKPSWTRANVLKGNAVRKDKIKRNLKKYVKRDKVIKSSRLPQVHRITAQRSFARCIRLGGNASSWPLCR